MLVKGILQIVVVMGSCIVGGVYVFVMLDVLIIVKEQGIIFFVGLLLVKVVMGEVVIVEDLGGGDVYICLFGVVDYLVEDDCYVLVIVCEVVVNLNIKVLD